MAHIQKLRLQRGWSQEQLAQASGLSTRTIQRLEAGGVPSVESLKSIAAVFDVDFHSLREHDMLNTEHATTPQPHTTANQHEREEAQAFRYVRRLKGLYRHALIYFVVISALWAFNLWRRPESLWVVWPTLGWGVGLAIHLMSVRLDMGLFGPAWERRQVEQRLGRPLS